MTTTENHIFARARAVATVLTHAERLGLPGPSIVTFYDDAALDSVGIHFDDYADLAAWSTYAEAPIESCEVDTGNVHHRFECEVHELPVSAVCIVQPTPVSTFECDRCGAAFGIAGQHHGTDDDYAADDYFTDEVRRHENGECTPPSWSRLSPRGASS